MFSLQAALEGSRVYQPLVKLSQCSGETLANWWKQATPGKLFYSVFEPITRWAATLPFANTLCNRWILLLGILLLFVLASFMSTNVIGLLLWALFFFTLLCSILMAKRPQEESRFKPYTTIDLAVGLFFVSILISTAFSSYLSTSIVGLMKMLTFLTGYLTFRRFFESSSPLILISLWCLLGLGVFESLVGYLQSQGELQPLATWQDPDTNPELKMTRVFGTLIPYNPNLLAGFLIPCFASALGLSGYYLSKGWRWAFVTGITLFSSALILYGLVMTGSRGSYLAIGIMGLSIFLLSGHLIFHDAALKAKTLLKWLWVGLLVAIVAGGALGISRSPKILNRLTSIFAMRDDSSISYRLNVYKSSWEIVQDNWLIGIGPGNDTFKQVYGLYMVPGYNALGAYSVPLEIAVEQGIVGIAALLLLLMLIKFRIAFLLESPHIKLQDKILGCLYFIGIFGSLAYGVFDTIWYRPAVNLLFWYYVAGASVLTERALGSHRSHGSETE